jgi:hypothetical protein
MSFYGRRHGGLHELQDGRKLAWDIADSIAPPMIRLAPGCHAYLREAIQLTDGGWIYPMRWFEQDGSLHGSGLLLAQMQDHFEVVPGDRVFRAIDIMHYDI